MHLKFCGDHSFKKVFLVGHVDLKNEKKNCEKQKSGFKDVIEGTNIFVHCT